MKIFPLECIQRNFCASPALSSVGVALSFCVCEMLQGMKQQPAIQPHCWPKISPRLHYKVNHRCKRSAREKEVRCALSLCCCCCSIPLWNNKSWACQRAKWLLRWEIRKMKLRRRRWERTRKTFLLSDTRRESCQKYKRAHLKFAFRALRKLPAHQRVNKYIIPSFEKD